MVKKEKDKEILFEIFDQEGNRLEWTTDARCLPSPALFLCHQQEKHSFKFNGKTIETYAPIKKAMGAS